MQSLIGMRGAARASAAEAVRDGALALVGRPFLVVAILAVVHAPLVGAVLLMRSADVSALVGLAVFAVMWLVSGPLTVAVLTEHTILGIGGDRRPFFQAFRQAFSGAARVLPTVLAVGVVQAVGYAAFVVPGIVASILLSLAIPVAIVERVSVGTAFARSAKLVTGSRLTMFFAIGMASTIAAIVTRIAAIGLDDLGWVVGIVVQAALVGAFSASVLVNRLAHHERVEIDAIVARLGGVFGAATRADDAAFDRRMDEAIAKAERGAGRSSPVARVETERFVDDATYEQTLRRRHARTRGALVAAAAVAITSILAVFAYGAWNVTR